MSQRSSESDRRDLVGKGEWTHLAVPPGCECPECREWCPDLLPWVDDNHVECETCGTKYEPATGRVQGRGQEGGCDDGDA